MPRPPQRWRPWFWLAALLLHVLVIGALLLFVHPSPLRQAFEPTGVSVVFSPGEVNPAAPRPSPIPTPAHAPAAAPPPPPPEQQAAEQPEVNLNLPDDDLSTPEFLPQPNTQPAPPAHPVRSTSHGARRTRGQRYVVMNDMSLHGTPSPPSPPSTFANRDLNLDAGGADASFANSAQISIKGDPGTNWEAIFNKWVNEHTYYPQAAAEQGQQGASTISFTVHRDGTVTGVRLLSSAGSPFLDQAWLGIFLQNNVPPFSPDAKDDSVHITATLDYVLEP